MTFYEFIILKMMKQLFIGGDSCLKMTDFLTQIRACRGVLIINGDTKAAPPAAVDSR